MRLTASIMAAIEKVVAPVLGRPPSAGPLNGVKAQTRGLQSNSSPVYKTQSDTSILAKAPNVLNRGINRVRQLSNGPGMKPVKTLEDVSDLLKSEAVKNVVVLAGAGISTPSGIPDFRTPGTGLYDNLQQYRIPYPEAIFDIDYFHHNPKPFFTLAKELYPSGKYRPNYIHYFLRMLHDKGMLLRMYTQNIDGLERLAGLPPEKLVEAHGTFASATCTICGRRKEGSEVKESIFKDRLPKCNKRGCPGIVKPDIVFFGEDLPQRFYLYLRDMLQTDLVIVMGTSLEVQPFAGIIDTVKYGVPRVLFNWNAVGPFKQGKRSSDVVAAGDLISSVQKFAEMTGWKTEIDDLIIQNEGSLHICSPEYAKKAANRPKPKTTKPEPVSNNYWRNRVANSSSEESSDSETESDSDSSSEDETRRYKSESFRRRGVRSTGSMKNNMGTATVKNGSGPNRLLNGIKKNGQNNNNGQKRELSTRVPSTRSPAPNSTVRQDTRVPSTRSPAPNSTVRQDKYSAGGNSVAGTRPPTGKFGSAKISQTKLLSTTEKASADKLMSTTEKTSADKLLSTTEKTSADKLMPLPNKITTVSTKSPLYSDIVKSQISENVLLQENIPVPENKVDDNTVNLTDTVVPSLERKVVTSAEIQQTSVNTNDIHTSISTVKSNTVESSPNKTVGVFAENENIAVSTEKVGTDEINTTVSTVKSNTSESSPNKTLENKHLEVTTDTVILSGENHSPNTINNAENTNPPTVLETVKEGIEKLALSDTPVSKIDQTSSTIIVQEAVSDVINSFSITKKKSLPSDILLSTRSEPAGLSNLGKLSSVETVKHPKPLINTIKSESALSSLSSREKYLKGSQSAGGKLDSSAKSRKNKNSEKFQRSVSEKNLRKKDKSDKKRSASAKAKVNLKLLHNRYAKNSKTVTSKDDEKLNENPNQNSSLSEANDPPYMNLIGTLQREKPLDFGQDISDLLDKCEVTATQGEFNPDDIDDKSANNEDMNGRLSCMSVQQTLPDSNQMCSDSATDRRHKRNHRRPPKPKRKSLDKDLNAVNPVPYGYATPRYKRLTNRAMIPANVCSGYELPSEYVSPELLQKLNSKNGVKLAYRHSIKSSPVGTRVIVREDSTNSDIIEKPVDIC